jgi:hypothetical protein
MAAGGELWPVARKRVIPLVYGLLRVHAEQDPVLRDAYEWLEPIGVPAATGECRSRP